MYVCITGVLEHQDETFLDTYMNGNNVNSLLKLDWAQPHIEEMHQIYEGDLWESNFSWILEPARVYCCLFKCYSVFLIRSCQTHDLSSKNLLNSNRYSKGVFDKVLTRDPDSSKPRLFAPTQLFGRLHTYLLVQACAAAQSADGLSSTPQQMEMLYQEISKLSVPQNFPGFVKKVKGLEFFNVQKFKSPDIFWKTGVDPPEGHHKLPADRLLDKQVHGWWSQHWTALHTGTPWLPRDVYKVSDRFLWFNSIIPDTPHYELTLLTEPASSRTASLSAFIDRKLTSWTSGAVRTTWTWSHSELEITKAHFKWKAADSSTCLSCCFRWLQRFHVLKENPSYYFIDKCRQLYRIPTWTTWSEWIKK